MSKHEEMPESRIKKESFARLNNEAIDSRVVYGGKKVGTETVRISGGSVERVSIPPSRPRETVRSSVIEKQRTASIVEELKSKDGLRKLGSEPISQTWRALLGGDNSQVSSRGMPKVSPGMVAKLVGAKYVEGLAHKKKIDTGVDYRKLGSESPTGHYKFYNSFTNKELATEYAVEVVKRSVEAGISISMKTFDHDYDGLNFYTHHFQELSEIITEVYPKYKSAFGSTEHFLQGSVNESIDPSHIGWVQEPVSGGGTRSHSGRMATVGGFLDSQGLSDESYRLGCAAAGVRPDSPWLLTAEYESQVIDTYRANTLHT